MKNIIRSQLYQLRKERLVWIVYIGLLLMPIANIFLQGELTLKGDYPTQAFLAENGIELSITQIITIKNGIAAKLGEKEELSEDELKSISGGAEIPEIITSIADAIGKLGDYVDKWTRNRW